MRPSGAESLLHRIKVEGGVSFAGEIEQNVICKREGTRQSAISISRPDQRSDRQHGPIQSLVRCVLGGRPRVLAGLIWSTFPLSRL